MTTIRKTYGGDVVQFKALPDAEGQKGRFEALVSVVGNVDYQGDRVMSGAFDKTLKTWRESGDPIPVIFSHDWSDPNAFIGSADPNDCEEIKAGQKDGYPHGGLLIRGRLFTEKAYAAQVYDLLKARLIKQWSFAYDVFDEEIADDKANNLNELGLLEVGPCLSGANPLTDTLGIKTRLDKAEQKDERFEMFERAMDVDPELAKFLFRDLVPKAEEPEVLPEIPEEVLNAQDVDPELAKALYGGTTSTTVDEKVEMKSPPWHIEERDGEYCVILDEDGSVVKCHASRDDAVAHMRALYANAASREDEVETKDDEPDEKAEFKWDGAAAMRSCSSAGDFRKIAFERDNDSDPDTAAHWALPHHASPGAEADSGGVSAALGALSGARGGAPDLKNAEAARSHLEAHGGGSSDEDKSVAADTTSTSNNITIKIDAKVGRVIGAKALAELKGMIDEWAARVNGQVDDESKSEDTPVDDDVDTKDDPNADLKARILELTRWSGIDKE